MPAILGRLKSRNKAATGAPAPDLRAQLARLEPELTGYHRRFLVNRMGSTGSTWLVKLLNSHPDVFCYHEGVLAQVFPATSYSSDDVVRFIHWLIRDDMHGAYRAIGDVGSTWLGHIQALPKGMFTVGVLLRHPARMLNTRLKVYKTDQSFTEIDHSCLRKIEESWGIKADRHGKMDQIFLQDLFHLCNQISGLRGVDVIIQLERMANADYCCDILHRLTDLHHERSLVELFLNNPVNRRTERNVSVAEIVGSFTDDQRAWYRQALQTSLPQCGYTVEDDSFVPLAGQRASGENRFEETLNRPEREPASHRMQALKQTIADQDRQIAHLQQTLAAIQGSAGWRLLNQWRKMRTRLLPAGSRRRRAYDSVVSSWRGARTA
ncbi:MAG: hypothetical protein ACM3PW_12500 [Chlamydiota bacterium]